MDFSMNSQGLSDVDYMQSYGISFNFIYDTLIRLKV